jgi:hypothetical protein
MIIKKQNFHETGRNLDRAPFSHQETCRSVLRPCASHQASAPCRPSLRLLLLLLLLLLKLLEENLLGFSPRLAGFRPSLPHCMMGVTWKLSRCILVKSFLFLEFYRSAISTGIWIL